MLNENAIDRQSLERLIQQRVETLFVSQENNCAMTVLRVLSEVFDTPVEAQVIDAAQCMPGAGGVKHLCGLVSGVLMFVGVWGAQHKLHRRFLGPVTQSFSTAVQQRFGSLDCRDLRQETGCAPLATEFLTFAIHHLDEHLGELALRTGHT